MLDNLRWTTQSINQRNALRRTDNTSGESGVHFHKSKDIWIAYWRDVNKKQQSKAFSVNKYGNEEAKLLAINYRRERARENGYLNI